MAKSKSNIKKLSRGFKMKPSSSNPSKKPASVSPPYSFETPPSKLKKKQKVPKSTSSTSTASTKRSSPPSPPSGTTQAAKKIKTLSLDSPVFDDGPKSTTKKTKKKLDQEFDADAAADDDDDDDDDVPPTTKTKTMEKKKKKKKMKSALDEAKACQASIESAGFASPTIAEIAASRDNPEAAKSTKKADKIAASRANLEAAKSTKKAAKRVKLDNKKKKAGKKGGKKDKKEKKDNPGRELPILNFMTLENYAEDELQALISMHSDYNASDLAELQGERELIAEFLHLYKPMELRIFFTHLHDRLNTPQEEYYKLMEGLGKWPKKYANKRALLSVYWRRHGMT